jgi:hypothetical protein
MSYPAGMKALVFLVSLAAIGGCGEASKAPLPRGAAVAEGSSSAPEFSRKESSATPSLAKAEPAAVEAPQEEESDGAPEPEAVDAPEQEKLPDVAIKNVGMHIGGEDNSAASKRPIRATVKNHYDAMRRCYAMADTPKKKTTFGVDIRIDGKGGKPKVSNPRNGLKGEGVTSCLVSVFEAIEFAPQPNGQARMVSYSVEFKKN